MYPTIVIFISVAHEPAHSNSCSPLPMGMDTPALQNYDYIKFCL